MKSTAQNQPSSMFFCDVHCVVFIGEREMVMVDREAWVLGVEVSVTIPAPLPANCVISYRFLNFSLSSSVKLEKKMSIHNGF